MKTISILKKVFFFALTSMSVACGLRDNDNSPVSGKEQITAAWVYDIDTDADGRIIDFCTALEVNTLFASIDVSRLPGGSSHSEIYTEKIRLFVKSALSAGIKTHAMILEHPRFTFTGYHGEAVKDLDVILTFNKKYPDESFRGVHIDVEPHALDEWKGAADDFSDGVHESLLRQFLILSSLLRDRIDHSGMDIDLSAAIAWWLDSKYREGILPSGNPELYRNCFDFVAVMSYSKGVSICEQIEDESEVIPVLAGIDTSNYTDRKSILEETAMLKEKFSENGNWMGTCIFHLSAYSSLNP